MAECSVSNFRGTLFDHEYPLRQIWRLPTVRQTETEFLTGKILCFETGECVRTAGTAVADECKLSLDQQATLHVSSTPIWEIIHNQGRSRFCYLSLVLFRVGVIIHSHLQSIPFSPFEIPQCRRH